MKKKRYDLAQAGFCQPIFNSLMARGVNLAPILNRSGLSSFNLENPESYFPLFLFDKFADEVESRLGIKNMAEEFKSELQLSCLGSWGELLARSPSMLDVCRKAESVSDVIFTNERIRIRINGKTAKYEQWFCGANEPERTQLIHINACLMLNTFKLFLGDGWEPREVHFQSHKGMDLSSFFPGARATKVYTGMPSTALVIDTHLLSQSHKGNSSFISELNRNFSVIASFSEQIETLLSSLQPGFIPTITKIAEMLDTSERTLRRELARESSSYAKIVDQWRCNEALLKIEDSRYQISDIAECLGYSNVPSFHRAFKRWTNYAPGVFRDLEC